MFCSTSGVSPVLWKRRNLIFKIYHISLYMRTARGHHRAASPGSRGGPCPWGVGMGAVFVFSRGSCGGDGQRDLYVSLSDLLL